MARQRRGRGRLSSIELLPPEAGDIVVWASQELASRDRTLTDIYAEFREKLIALQGEQGLAFDIPAFSSFHRYSVFQAELARDMEETRTIASALASRLDTIENEDMTIMILEMAKSAFFHILRARGRELKPKEAMEMARGMQALVATSQLSATARAKAQAAIEAAQDEVLEKAEAVVREAGVSADAIAQMRREFLGVRPKKPGEAIKLDTEE